MVQKPDSVEETGLDTDWLGVFDEYGVGFLILGPHTDGDLVNLLRSQPGWRIDFEDTEAVLFARADTSLAA
jgi:hypothetical protein